MKPISISGSHIERLDGAITGKWLQQDTPWGDITCYVSVHELRDHACKPCKPGCNPLTCNSDEHLVRVDAWLRLAIPLEDVPNSLVKE